MSDVLNSKIFMIISGLLTLAIEPAYAAQLQGQVTTEEGAPIAAAIVTLFDQSGLNSESVYTNSSGRFVLNTGYKGEARLRVRSPDFADYKQQIRLSEPSQAYEIQLKQLQDPHALAQTFTASAYAAKIEFDDEEDATSFRSQCHYCHQIGNELTRRVRSKEQWTDVMNRMQSYGALITSKNETAFIDQLHSTFNGDPITATQTWQQSDKISNAIYKEWSVGDASSYIHDVDIGQDNKIYGVDMGNDKIYILDPANGQRKVVEFPESDLPLGGLFAGAIAPLGTFYAKHGPHSIQTGPQGKLWITNSLATEIMSYDPETGQFKIYPVGGDAIYPHTLRFDKKGILWFTIALSNQIGRFDPETETFTLIDTPSNGAMRWITDAFLPSMLKVASWFPKEDLQLTMSHHKISGEGYKIFNLPYGIDVSPVDGSIWYSKLYSSYIGRVDPETLEVEEIETPLLGPRRLRFDASGKIWIPSFEENAIMRFDPKTKTFKTYKLPNLAPNEYETPYALGVHPETQDVWITSNMSDRVFRFIPSEERFYAYPSPTRVAFLRDIVFMDDGGVCSSNSNLPASAIEGGVPKVLCIYPGDE